MGTGGRPFLVQSKRLKEFESAIRKQSEVILPPLIEDGRQPFNHPCIVCGEHFLGPLSKRFCSLQCAKEYKR